MDGKQDMKFLPVGIQTFSSIAQGGYVYVDKTEHIHRLLRKPKGLYFLSRPRRFGKSLLISTLEALFQGKRELFDGLWIGQEGRWDWPVHPVVKLDLSGISNGAPAKLEKGLKGEIAYIADLHGISLQKDRELPELFTDLIRSLRRQTGRQVVILIDEYDKPIVDHLEEEQLETAKANRAVLKNFYGVLKKCEEDLRLLFITGVSKFSRTSVFSALNNLDDLTLAQEAADLVGYTESELHAYFADHIDRLVEKFDQDRAELLGWVREWYNGYRFSAEDLRVYNPFTTLLLLEHRNFSSYWYSTGTPTFLIDLINRQPEQDKTFADREIPEHRFRDAWDLENLELLPLLVQTGYLTIDGCRRTPSNELLYTLRYPNLEVRQAFFEQLIKSRCNAEHNAAARSLHL